MPPRNEALATPAQPLNEMPLVAIDSPEFNDAVSRAVAAAMAKMPPVAPREIAVQAPPVIPRTSIDQTAPGLDDLTIRFNRFCTMANHGYQRGQEAGFPRKLAMSAVASGSAILVHDPRVHRARAA